MRGRLPKKLTLVKNKGPEAAPGLRKIRSLAIESSGAVMFGHDALGVVGQRFRLGQ